MVALLQNRDYNILVAMYTYPQLAHRPTRQTFERQARSNWSEKAEIISFRKSLGQCPYKTLQGTQKIHQMTIDDGDGEFSVKSIPVYAVNANKRTLRTVPTRTA